MGTRDFLRILSELEFRSLAVIARSCTRELNKTLLLFFLYFDETQALFYRKSISEAIFQQRVSCTPLRSAHYCTRSVTYGGSCNISVDFFQPIVEKLFIWLYRFDSSFYFFLFNYPLSLQLSLSLLTVFFYNL